MKKEVNEIQMAKDLNNYNPYTTIMVFSNDYLKMISIKYIPIKYKIYYSTSADFYINIFSYIVIDNSFKL